jgi:hypothetical protein
MGKGKNRIKLKDQPQWELDIAVLLRGMKIHKISYEEIRTSCGQRDGLSLQHITNIANNYKHPPRYFCFLFIKFVRDRVPQVTVPETLAIEFQNEPSSPCKSELFEYTRRYQQALQSIATSADREIDREYEVRVVIGRKTTIDEDTAKYGDSLYWLIYSLEKSRAVVHKCRLFPQDTKSPEPKFRSWRFAADGTKYFQDGSYFSNSEELFLLGSRNGVLDVRMSLFHCNPGGDPRFLRGITSGLTSQNEVFSAKAVLIQHDCSCVGGVCPCERKEKDDYLKTGIKEWKDVCSWLVEPTGVATEVAEYLFSAQSLIVPRVS